MALDYEADTPVIKKLKAWGVEPDRLQLTFENLVAKATTQLRREHESSGHEFGVQYSFENLGDGMLWSTRMDVDLESTTGSIIEALRAPDTEY